jgi:hypothetical protein
MTYAGRARPAASAGGGSGGEVEGGGELAGVGPDVQAGVGALGQEHGVGDGGPQQPGHDLDVEVLELARGLAIEQDLLERRLVGLRLAGSGWNSASRAGGQGRMPGPETRAVFRMALPYTCLGTEGRRCSVSKLCWPITS